MEVDLPYSFHTFSRTHKHALLKAVPSIRNLLGPNFRLSPQKKRSLPGPSQLDSDLTPTELPPLQVTPAKNANNTRQRSSSTGNDPKQAAFRRQFDSRGIESQQERDRNPVRHRVELAPLTGTIKGSSKAYSSVARKNSLDDQARTPQPPESIFQLRNRGEPIRTPLSQVFGVRRRTPAKKEIKTIDYVSNYATNEKEETSSSAAPKAWQDLTPKDLVFSPNVPQHIMLTHFLSVVQGIRYAIGQVKPLPISQLAPLQVTLRRKKEGLTKTLILDLDETLVYAKKTEDDEVKEKFPSLDGNENSVFTVKIRPHAEEFLREMSKEFEVIVFTAGEKAYAESVLKFLDPEQKYISHLLHRGHCLRTKRGLFIKDLRVILGRELKDMVIVDNCAHSFSFQIDNGIPIITWNGDVKDQELKYLMPYLLEAKKYDDMRQYNKEKLRLEELSEIPASNFPNI